jgi:hypothetical protein
MDVAASFRVIGPMQSDTLYFWPTYWHLVTSIAVVDIASFGYYMPKGYVPVLGIDQFVVLVLGAGEKARDLGDGSKSIYFFVPSKLFCLSSGYLVFED